MSTDLSLSDTFDETLAYFKKNHSKFLVILALMFVIECSEIALDFIFPAKEIAKHLFTVLIGVLVLWLQATVMIFIFQPPNEGEGVGLLLWEGACTTPSFILYHLLFGLAAIFGGLFFIIPGLYILLTYYFAPYLVIFEPESEMSYFKWSSRISEGVKWEVFQVIFASTIITLFFEVFNHIPVALGPKIFLQLLSALMSSFFFIFLSGFLAHLVMKLNFLSKTSNGHE